MPDAAHCREAAARLLASARTRFDDCGSVPPNGHCCVNSDLLVALCRAAGLRVDHVGHAADEYESSRCPACRAAWEARPRLRDLASQERLVAAARAALADLKLPNFPDPFGPSTAEWNAVPREERYLVHALRFYDPKDEDQPDRIPGALLGILHNRLSSTPPAPIGLSPAVEREVWLALDAPDARCFCPPCNRRFREVTGHDPRTGAQLAEPPEEASHVG